MSTNASRKKQYGIYMENILTRKVVVPFNHKITKSIRHKYKDLTTHSLPRIISNAKLNLYIKEVCSLIPSLQIEIELTKTKGGKEFILKQEKYKSSLKADRCTSQKVVCKRRCHDQTACKMTPSRDTHP